MNPVFDSKYQLIRELGAGTFGIVFLAKEVATGRKVAVKQLKLTKSALLKRMPNFTREIEMMRGMRHPNVVQFIEQFERQERIFIVTEFCEMGELAKYIESGRQLDRPLVIEVCRQMIHGLEYIHRKGYMHRDLKPENIFIAEGFVAKIGDYGLGKKYVEGVRNTRNVGTPLYTPPDILNGQEEYTQKCDVFSLGLIIYYLVIGEHLFQSALHIRHILEKQKELEQVNIDKFINQLNCNDSFKRVLKASLPYEERNRMTSTQLRVLYDKEFPPAKQITVVRDYRYDIQEYFREIKQRVSDIQKYLHVAQLLLRGNGSVLNKTQSCVVALLALNIYLIVMNKVIQETGKQELTVGMDTFKWSDINGATEIRDRFMLVLNGEFKTAERALRKVVYRAMQPAIEKSTILPFKVLELLQQPSQKVISANWMVYRSTLIKYLKQQWKPELIASTKQQQTICDCIHSLVS